MLPWSISSTIKPAARRALGVRRGERLVGQRPPCAARRSRAADRPSGCIRRSTTCRLLAVDFDLELRGGEVGDLPAVVVERGDVDGHQLDAGAKHGAAGAGWGLGAWGLAGLGRLRGSAMQIQRDDRGQPAHARDLTPAARQAQAPSPKSQARLQSSGYACSRRHHRRRRPVRASPPPLPPSISISTTSSSSKARSSTRSRGFPSTWCSSPRRSCSKSAACR